MKRAIITPTYIGHFNYIAKYLKSFEKYLLNKNFPICFVIQKSENEEFQKIVKHYKNILNINIFYLEDIFEKYNISETPKEILQKYGRLSFQTIKKLYGGLYSNADEFFFLDSESMLIKPTNMDEVFDGYFKSPNFFMTKVADRYECYKETFAYNYICTVARILNIKPNYWTVDSYEWFYKREILEDLINDLGQPIDIIKKVIPSGKFPDLEGVLEALLYYLYIFKNNKKYKYDIFIVQDEFKSCLGEENYADFRRDFDSNKNLRVSGLYELCSYYINKNNVDGFIKLFNEKNIQVMRFAFPDNNNYEYQEKVINNTKICILPSDQEHLFGLNNTFLAIWCYRHNVGCFYRKLIKHYNKISLINLFEIFSILFYLIAIFTKGMIKRGQIK